MTQRHPAFKFAGQLTSFVRQNLHEQGGGPRSGSGWIPAVNIYQISERLEVCLDLAGMDPTGIDVQVEQGRLVIRGVRQPPEPRCAKGQHLRILNMEIDYGPFQREITLPANVALDRVQSHYAEGLLRISLPLIRE